MGLSVIVTISFFLSTGLLSAQQSISGRVVDAQTNEPLIGVSIFFDGTTIGTVTDENGYFELSTSKTLTGTLVFDFLGYETRVFDEVGNGAMGVVQMGEEPVKLDEIVLIPDTWSRKKKLRIFRREFLGITKAGIRSKIINESDIRLYYSSTENKLYAFAKKPLAIANKYLGYQLTYNLKAFEVDFFDYQQEDPITKATYQAGTVFFSDYNKTKSKNSYNKRRKEVYLGSGLHFMRSLAKQTLTSSGFTIFRRGFQVDPKEVYSIQTVEGSLTQAIQRVDKLSILFKDQERSVIQIPERNILIDAYGNYQPTRNVLFGGHIGAKRAGDMLPLDYEIE